MQTTQGYLSGQFLIAMPQMTDPRFERSVVYLCAHTAEGAMGIIVNRRFDGLTFSELLEQLEIPTYGTAIPLPIYSGGPVENGRGFVLHSCDYMHDTSMIVSEGVALTATIDILKAIADGDGPRRYLLALGYAGWSAGQLDSEIRDNAWLNVPADEDLLFESDLSGKWEAAIHKLGIESAALSMEAGHA